MKRKTFIGFLMSMVLWGACQIPAWAAMAIGVLPESAAGVTVVRKGETPANPLFLYEGDRLQGTGLADLDIRWHPGAQGIMNGDNEMVVAFDTAGEKSWLSKVQQFLGFGAAETRTALNVTRGQPMKANLAPIPGFSVTLLAGEKVPFAWGSTAGQTLIFKDEAQNVIFRKAVAGQSAIRLSPEEIGLKPGQVYTWSVEGLPGSCQVVLLDADTQAKIAADLLRLESEAGNPTDKLIKKAAYLQLISDVQPQKMDLYWLSYRLLLDDKTTDSKARETAKMLELRVSNHLNGPVYNFILPGR